MIGAPAALRRLAEKRPPSQEAVSSFLRRHQFPLRTGRITTFVFRGEADGVRLRHWIYGLPASQPLARLPRTDLWHLSLELPERSRIEYKLEIETGGETDLILDPLNPLTARDPFGANSVCHGPGYEIPDWTLPDPEARPGRLEQLTVKSRAFADQREIVVYRPPRLRPRRRHPLLVVHDGADFLRYAEMKTVLDNLIFRLEIAPLVVAFVQADERLVEYADDRRHARFLTGELLPALESAYPLTRRWTERGLMGASFGAVAALSAAWRRPGVWGRLLLQSGSFAFTDIGENRRGPEFDPVVRFMNSFRERPGRPSDRIFVSCGIYESLIYENRSMVPLLQDTEVKLRFIEARDGHNWQNWRDRLREGLSYLFPGPLWLVYE